METGCIASEVPQKRKEEKKGGEERTEERKEFCSEAWLKNSPHAQTTFPARKLILNFSGGAGAQQPGVRNFQILIKFLKF